MKKMCLIVLISLLVVGVYAQQSTKTLSVTTFSNTSGVKDFQWLNTALSDMLTTDLGASKHLTVVQRNRLGELLKEQEFQASGIVDEKSAVAAGKILGADTLVFGDFIISGGKLRINANLVTVMTGKTLSAASVTGATEDIFVLEKLLAARLIETMGITLSDAERIALFQMPSRSITALEQNYRGVTALEDNDVEAAKTYFAKATAADPYYRDAQKNLEKASFNFSGSDLAKMAADDTTRRVAQIKAAQAIRDEMLRNLFVFKINGNPRVVKTYPATDTADVAIDWSVSYNPETLKHIDAFFSDLVKSNFGDEEGKFSMKLPGSDKTIEYKFTWCSEVKEILYDNYYGIDVYWIPVFSLTDPSGKLSLGVLHGVRCSMSDDDIVGDDANIQIYNRGGFAKFEQMYRGSVWAKPAKLKPDERSAVLKGVPKADLPKLTQVKVGLAAVRYSDNGNWPFKQF